MLLNKPLILASDLAATSNSDIFDALAAGDAEKQLWIRIVSGSTAATGGTFSLVTGNAYSGSDITSPKTLIAVTAAATTAVGDVLLQARIPLGVLRYLQVQVADGVGTYYAEIVQDAETASAELPNTYAVVN